MTILYCVGASLAAIIAVIFAFHIDSKREQRLKDFVKKEVKASEERIMKHIDKTASKQLKTDLALAK